MCQCQSRNWLVSKNQLLVIVLIMIAYENKLWYIKPILSLSEVSWSFCIFSLQLTICLILKNNFSSMRDSTNNSFENVNLWQTNCFNLFCENLHFINWKLQATIKRFGFSSFWIFTLWTLYVVRANISWLLIVISNDRIWKFSYKCFSS